MCLDFKILDAAQIKREIWEWINFAKTLVHWKRTKVFLDVRIQGIAHNKAPLF